MKTFSIGFHESGYDEAVAARRVAEHLGTDHTELYVTSADAEQVISELPAIYDEPFADSSQIPTLIVSRLAARQVVVSLSGDGGDELFAGYTRYQRLERLQKVLRRVPRPLSRLTSRLLRQSPLSALVGSACGVLGRTDRGALVRKLRRLSLLLEDTSADGLYRVLVSYAQPSESLVLGPVSLARLGRGGAAATHLTDPVERAMWLDQVTYLPDDILTKVDRAAMATSLETRVPLLDHRIVEFAWRLPMSYRVRDGRSKAVLRAVLSRHVPSHLTERPKMGFGIPLGDWLRGPLRPWAEELLTSRQATDDDLLNASAVGRMWSEHLAGQTNWQHELWAVLMFRAWHEQQSRNLLPVAA